MTGEAVSPETVQRLVEQLATEPQSFGADLNCSAAFRELNAFGPEGKHAGVMALLAWLNEHSGPDPNMHVWQLRGSMLALLAELLAEPWPLTEADLRALLDWSARQAYYTQRGLPGIIAAIENFSREQPLTVELQRHVRQLIGRLQMEVQRPNVSVWISSLQQAARIAQPSLPLVPGEAWADVAMAEIETQSDEVVAAWRQLLLHCQGAAGTKPSKKWLAGAQPALARIGAEAFKASVMRWFALVDKPRTELVFSESGWVPDPTRPGNTATPIF